MFEIAITQGLKHGIFRFFTLDLSLNYLKRLLLHISYEEYKINNKMGVVG